MADEHNEIEQKLRDNLKSLSRHELDMSRMITKFGGYCTAIIGIGSILLALFMPSIPMFIVAFVAVYYSSKYSIASDILILLIDELTDEYDR